jgi:hypothetical protein
MSSYRGKKNRGGVYNRPSNQRSDNGFSANVKPSYKKEKFRWINPETGDHLSAGGILFYSLKDPGVFWALEETCKKGFVSLDSSTPRNAVTEYNDIGGKYSPDDGNIFATIRRELYEETYGLIDILVSDIKRFSDKYGSKRVLNHKGECVYICICVPIDDIVNASTRGTSRLEEDEMDAKFSLLRDNTIKQNPKAVYKPLKLVKLKFDPAPAEREPKLSYRLSTILKQLFPLKETKLEDETLSDDDSDENVNCIILGSTYDQLVTSRWCTAMGVGASAIGTCSIAIGDNAKAHGNFEVNTSEIITLYDREDPGEYIFDITYLNKAKEYYLTFEGHKDVPPNFCKDAALAIDRLVVLFEKKMKL